MVKSGNAWIYKSYRKNTYLNNLENYARINKKGLWKELYKKEKIQEIDWIDITNNKLAEEETSKDSKQLLRLSLIHI